MALCIRGSSRRRVVCMLIGVSKCCAVLVFAVVVWCGRRSLGCIAPRVMTLAILYCVAGVMLAWSAAHVGPALGGQCWNGNQGVRVVGIGGSGA